MLMGWKVTDNIESMGGGGVRDLKSGVMSQQLLEDPADIRYAVAHRKFSPHF